MTKWATFILIDVEKQEKNVFYVYFSSVLINKIWI